MSAQHIASVVDQVASIYSKEAKPSLGEPIRSAHFPEV